VSGIEALRRARDLGLIDSLDLHFARWLARLAGKEQSGLLGAAALVSRETGRGHVCVHLKEHAGGRLFADPASGLAGLSVPEAAQWSRELRESGMVGEPGEHAPLILDPEGRLYLARYWHFEARLADALRERSVPAPNPPDSAWMRSVLDRLFPGADDETPDWQKVAVAVAALRQLTVVSGGPGTGKTRTVAAILALVVEAARPGRLRIALAAPTGKAAARLGESVRAALDDLDCPEAVRRAIPCEAVTLHRLLGVGPARARVRYGPDNPLHLDLVVVDEASMVDLPMMSRLFAALPRGARVVLLGDKDQLASVEAGYVLGDLCDAPRLPSFSPSFRSRLKEVIGWDPGGAEQAWKLGDSLVVLRRSYRFDSRSGLGALAAAVNGGDAAAALKLLQSPSEADLEWVEPGAEALTGEVLRRWSRDYGAILSDADPGRVLEALARLRILCALREGPFGTRRANELIEQGLRQAGAVGLGHPWYAGRPIMITRNDYALGLFNGDLGVILPDTEGRLRAWLQGPRGQLRALAPGRLPAHETVYAMTVHKSQGSEFDQVLLVLAGGEQGLITRELVYTALTRARRRVTLVSSAEHFGDALARRTRRVSALRGRLWRDKDEQVPMAETWLQQSFELK
jgi:exodeoxyribonuclease V alpha subunit